MTTARMRCFVVLMLISVATCPFAAAQEGRKHGESVNVRTVGKEWQKWHGFGDGFVKKLEEPQLWQDAQPRIIDGKRVVNEERVTELLSYLTAVKVIRYEPAVPVLIAHITYSPYEHLNIRKRRLPREVEFPVYGVLAAIGPAAIPALLKRLMALNLDPGKMRGADKHRLRQLLVKRKLEHLLLRKCLVTIYAESRDYKSRYHMAEARVKLEIDRIRKRGDVTAVKRLERVLADIQKERKQVLQN